MGSAEELVRRRFRLLVLLGMVLVGLSKWLYLSGLLLPNLELVIPTLVVVGSFAPSLGEEGGWGRVNRYFGVLALLAVFLTDLWVWGWRPIYLFTWSGFLLAWGLGLRSRLSPFSSFPSLLGSSLITTAAAILLFDLWTGVVGWSLLHAPLWVAFLGQVPFTLRHLSSLLFVPPLVGAVKLLVRVRVPVGVAVRAGGGIRSGVRS
ncbi:MAG: hypothetical protein NQU48_02645 [Hadesarchaea archaeon]|jgi:hypothetical protein|nr:hypothetical protein [Hadesarchaea archaeon]